MALAKHCERHAHLSGRAHVECHEMPQGHATKQRITKARHVTEVHYLRRLLQGFEVHYLLRLL